MESKETRVSNNNQSSSADQIRIIVEEFSQVTPSVVHQLSVTTNQTNDNSSNYKFPTSSSCNNDRVPDTAIGPTEDYNYHCMTLVGILLIITIILIIIIILPFSTRHQATPHIM